MAGREAGGGAVAHGELLLELAELAVGGLYRGGEGAALADCRRRVVAALGQPALLDACGVVGMFNGINIIADMGGVRMDDMMAPFAADILEKMRIESPPNWGPTIGAKL